MGEISRHNNIAALIDNLLIRQAKHLKEGRSESLDVPHGLQESDKNDRGIFIEEVHININLEFKNILFYFFIVNEILRFPLLNIKVIDEYFSHFCTFNAIRVEVVNDMKVLLYHVPHLDECLTLFVEDFDINVILTQENVDISLELKSLSEAIIEIFHCHVKFYA